MNLNSSVNYSIKKQNNSIMYYNFFFIEKVITIKFAFNIIIIIVKQLGTEGKLL